MKIVRPDLAQRKPGEVERGGRAGADVKAGRAADGGIGGEDDLVQRVLVAGAGIDQSPDPTHTVSGDLDDLGVGDGLAVDIERGAALHHGLTAHPARTEGACAFPPSGVPAETVVTPV